MTSATLAVGGRFDYVEERLGVSPAGDAAPVGGAGVRCAARPGPLHEPAATEPKRVERLLLPSPFDYARQAVLGLVSTMPEPGAPGYDGALCEVLLGAARASGGAAFFLFTSYAALRRAFHRLERPLADLGLTCLRQGDAPRAHLLEQFRTRAPAVLFGTDSFWEGVDVRGDALRLVAIAKLPFRVPSEPLQEARVEALRARGRDPFRGLALPQAVLRLKQGFGRLVRSRADRGAVLMLDKRVVSRSYGHLFLRSLPPARRVKGSPEVVLAAVRRAAGSPASGVV
jgi:ATP-dependent DNA helicase DinG